MYRRFKITKTKIIKTNMLDLGVMQSEVNVESVVVKMT